MLSSFKNIFLERHGGEPWRFTDCVLSLVSGHMFLAQLKQCPLGIRWVLNYSLLEQEGALANVNLSAHCPIRHPASFTFISFPPHNNPMKCGYPVYRWELKIICSGLPNTIQGEQRFWPSLLESFHDPSLPEKP